MARIRAQTGGGGLGITPTSVSFYDVLAAGGTIAQMAVGGGLTGTWSLVNSSSSLVALSAGGLLTRGAGAATTGAPIVSFTSTDGNTILQIPVVATVIVATLPANTVLPALSPSGAPVVGVSVTATPGTWTGNPAPTFAYQWRQVDTSTNIAGATSATYTPVAGDVGHTLTCVVSATNIKGGPVTASAATTPAVLAAPVAPAAPVNTVAPGVPSGSANVGSVLTASTGTWTGSPTPTYTYQWKWGDTGALISGATGSTYTPVSGDVGHPIAYNVTATNGSRAVSASSAATAAVASLSPDQAFAAAMPSGKLAWWPFDQYQATNSIVPNMLSATAPDQMINRTARRMVGHASNHIFVSGLTVTEGIADPNGGTEAVHLLSTGGSAYCGANFPDSAPAQKTIAVWLKSNTGADQSLRMQLGGTDYAITVTSTWQRFTASKSFTSGFAMFVWSIDNAAYDILMFDPHLMPGTVDTLAASPGPQGHIYLGSSTTRNEVPVDSGAALSMTNEAGLIQFPKGLTLPQFTIISTVKKVSAGSGYASTLNEIQGASTSFSAGLFYTDRGPKLVWQGTEIQYLQSGAWPDRAQSSGYHNVAITYDLNTAYYYLDDMVFEFQGGVATAIAMADFYFGSVNGYNLPTGHQFHNVEMYNRALTYAEIRARHTAIKARAATKGITITPNSFVYAADGDSISTETASWTHKFAANANAGTVGAIVSRSGTGMASPVSQGAFVDSMITDVSKKYVLSLLIGANDLGSYASSPSTYASTVRSYCLARQAAGWNVVICTNTPINDDSFETARQGVAAIYRAWTASDGIAGIIDFAADATMGPRSAASDTSLYRDGLHPTDAGYANMEAIARPVLNGLLV